MTVAEVKLWGTTIGAVSIDNSSKFCNFKYDPNFIKSGIEVSPIVMPLSDAIYTFNSLSIESFHGLPGLLSDSIPDKFGQAVINAWLSSLGRTRESFDIVENLCIVGKRGMGALEFYPDKSQKVSKDDEIKIQKLVEIGNEILSMKENQSYTGNHALNDLIKVGTSAGGARAKAIVAYNEETKEFRSGQVETNSGFSYWIIKFDGITHQNEDAQSLPYTRIEYAYYLMATCAGINMSESRLYEDEGLYHFMTKRFDRTQTENGKIDKIHMQTLGALMHRDYNQSGLVSYEEAGQVMRRLGLSQGELTQFFKRMVFNVMTRNQDDHIKNISFLMNRKGNWSLSPAYDMTYSYNPTGKYTATHQMSINGKRSEFTIEDIKKCAVSMDVKEKTAIQVVDDISQAILKWDEFAAFAFLEKNVSDAIKKSFRSLS
jgi:serine/threonine-protein kinase HipA